MIPLLLAMLGTALQSPNVIWLDAFEARDSGIEIGAAQSYHVWAWTQLKDPAEITLGVETLSIPADPAQTGFAWKHAGTIQLPKGRIGAALTENVAGITLTTLQSYDPAKVAGEMRVNRDPVAIGDTRATIDRDTNSIFSMPTYSSKEEWEQSAADIRRKMLVACGLWPMPERTPLKASVTEVARHDDYIVEKVSFEARPGFLVTGNLYRPVGAGPYPGVICPHGHWKEGRFENTDLCSVAGRCITFARMGMAAFTYDMVAYNDSKQFPHGWGHGGGFDQEARKREALWGIHPFAMQLWSSVRALDFMESLPYVDRDRLACTGASGGGTQTFALYSIDQRVKVSAPVNMISHSMQGGCPCENAPIIRINANNMEIGAMMAPRPMMMIAATGDWTRDTPRVEYPAIKSVYALYGADANLESIQIDAGHNYNKDSREGVYRFFGKHLLGGEQWASYTEPAFELEPVESLKVFPGNAVPENYPKYPEYITQLEQEIQAKWNAILPKDAAGLDAFAQTARPALADALGLASIAPGDIRGNVNSRDEHDTYSFVRSKVVVSGNKLMALPVTIYIPKGKTPIGSVVVAHENGKAALVDLENGGPGRLVKALLDSGRTVFAVDVFLVGEQHAPAQRTARLMKNFPDTFLPTDTGYRVQDVLTTIAYARTGEFKSGPIDVVGIGDGGMWSLLAGAVDKDVRTVVVDANKFAANDNAAWVKEHYIPSIRALGGITTAITLNAAHGLAVFNADDAGAWTSAAQTYATVKGVDAASVVSGGPITPEATVAAIQ